MEHKYTQLDLMQARVHQVPEGWNFLPISKAFKIRNELRKPISDEVRSTQQGEYPYYGPTKIQDYIDTYEQDGSFALIGEDGDHFLKYKKQPMTQLVDGKCTVNNHAHIIEGTNLATREWFYYYFMHRDIFSYLSRQGAGRYKLNKASLEKIYLLLPSIDEQKKIAQILSTWDQAIATTEQLLANSQQQKKALMQQLLTGKIRLLDESGVRFSGEWEQLKVSDLLKNRKEKQIPTAEVPLFSLTIEDGVTPKSDRYNREFLVKNTDEKKYKVVRPKDIVYNPANLRWGAINYSRVAHSVVVSPIYEVLYVVEKDKISLEFIAQKLMTRDQINRFAAMVEGTLVERMAVKIEPFLATKLSIPPSLKEQQKIATFLSTADQEIEVLQKKLECLKQEKKALMQRLLTGKRRVKVAA